MSDFEELDPRTEETLRAVPRASASMRDAHIAAALAESTPQRRSTVGFMNNRARSLAAIAVVLVLLLSGVSVFTGGTTLNDNATSPNSTVPVKTGADCSEEFSGLLENATDSKEFAHGGNRFALIFGDGNIDVYQAVEPCASVGTLAYQEALVARDKETAQSDSTSVCSYTTEPIARFADAANGDSHNLVLVHTDTGLNLHFEDRCDSPIATLDLP